MKACEKRREKGRERERKERERKKRERKKGERKKGERKKGRRERKEPIDFSIEIDKEGTAIFVDVGRIALKNTIKISDEGTEWRLMDRLSKFIQVDRLVEIENLQIGLRFFRGGVICKAFVIIYWDSY